MEVKLETSPWPHAIVRNFFSDDVFKELNEYSLNILEKYGKDTATPKYGLTESSHHRKYGTELGDIGLKVSNNLIEFYKTYYKDLDTGNNQFYDIEPKHVILEFQARPANEQYPDQGPNIHTDSPFKIMSFVIGLSDFGAGTTLYFEDATKSHETEWAPNGGLVFVRNTHPGKRTLHSIHNTVNSIRRVLVVFIADPFGEKFNQGVKK